MAVGAAGSREEILFWTMLQSGLEEDVEAAGGREEILFWVMLQFGLEEDVEEVLAFCLRGAAAVGAASLKVLAVSCCLFFAER